MIDSIQESELVYACDYYGAAAYAIALTAQEVGKRVTLFYLSPKLETDLFKKATNLPNVTYEIVEGAKTQIGASKRAMEYAKEHGAKFLPIGLDFPEFGAKLEEVVRSANIIAPEIWCMGGSGTLGRALQRAYPRIPVHIVSIDPEWLSARVHNTAAGRFFDLALGEADGRVVVDAITELELTPKSAASGAGAETMADESKIETGAGTAEARTQALLAAVGDASPEAVVEALALAAAARGAGAGTPEALTALAARRPGESDAVTLLQAELGRRDVRLAALETEASGLREERRRLQGIRELADRIVDTTRLSVHELRRAILGLASGIASVPLASPSRSAGASACSR